MEKIKKKKWILCITGKASEITEIIQKESDQIHKAADTTPQKREYK